MIDDGPFSEGLVYELAGWTPAQRRELASRLASAGISFEWDAEDVVVAESDGDAVEAVLDAIEYPDALPEMPDDPAGEESVEALASVFVAADRLCHHPGDPGLAGELLDSYQSLGPAPYGIAPATWDALRAVVGRLVEAVGTEPFDTERVAEAAGEARAQLRPWI